MIHPHAWHRRRTLVVLASVWTGGGIAAAKPSAPASASAPGPGARPADWATPLPELGVPNLHLIAPGLYRSAQPRAQDVAALQRLGIRTVVSLRSFNSDEAVFKGSGITLVRVPINTWHIGDEQVVKALRALRAARASGPVLLHCQHGADRTGVISAVLRMTEQGWSRKQAMDEMFRGGYGYHTLWRNIPAYLQRVDAQALQARVAVAEPGR